MSNVRHWLVAALCAAASIGFGAPALGSWSASASASTAASARSLAPPTSPTAAGGCRFLVLGPVVTVRWVPSTSSFTTGYDIFRSNSAGGTYTLVGTAVGGATDVFEDTAVNGFSSTYYYRIRSTANSWTSSPTSTVSARTPFLCF